MKNKDTYTYGLPIGSQIGWLWRPNSDTRASNERHLQAAMDMGVIAICRAVHATTGRYICAVENLGPDEGHFIRRINDNGNWRLYYAANWSHGWDSEGMHGTRKAFEYGFAALLGGALKFDADSSLVYGTWQWHTVPDDAQPGIWVPDRFAGD